MRSKSPEDSSSLLSASAGSLDSMLNHSREEEELRVAMDQSTDCELRMENDISDIGKNINLNNVIYYKIIGRLQPQTVHTIGKETLLFITVQHLH